MHLQLIMWHFDHLVDIALLLVLMSTMYLKRMHLQVPVFFAYSVYAPVGLAITYGLYQAYYLWPGWYSMWIDDGIAILIEFGILAEIFRKLFAPYTTIWRFACIAMVWVSVAIVLVSAAFALFFHQASYSVPILTVVLVLDRSLRTIQLGLVVGLFALSKYLHLRWKNFSFGIALGFGFFALVMLAGSTIRMYYGQLVAGAVNIIQGLAYCAALLIWCSYALQREVASIPIASLPSHQLEQWDEALKQMLSSKSSSGGRKPPTFDGTSESDAESANEDDKVVR